MDSLLNKRRAIKGQLTRFEAVVAGQATRALSDTAVKTYRDKIDKLSSDLEILQEAIVEGSTVANFDANETAYNELIERAETLSIILNDLLDQRHPRTGQVTADVKLPKLELPSFSGNYVEWFTFHDLFTATVHNSSLSGAQKLQYLKTSLRGEAALLISSIQITDGNYAEAWNILLNRYNNTREVIDAHIKRLFNQPVVKEESASAIRCLIDTTTECVRSLRVLNEPVDQWDAVLLHIVKEKIDPDSRRQWELSLTGTSRPPFQDLTMFLEQRARALMASQTSSNFQKNRPVTYPRKSTLTHHGAIQETSCSICREAHAVYRCETLLKAAIEDRWKIVKKHSLCYNCLRADHPSHKCKSGTCRKCSGRHNTLLHQDKKSNEEVTPTQNGVNCLISREAVPTSQVLLATSIIQVEASNGKLQQVRALLDSGSQASFISEQCYKKLQLKRRRLVVTVGGIGTLGIGTSRGSVELIINTGDQSNPIEVTALILKNVTDDLPNLPINIKSWAHIKDLRLADSTFHLPGSIDVLLGADVYLSLVQDGVCTGHPGTAGAFNTIFGWVVCGPIGKQMSTQVSQDIQVFSTTIDAQLSRFWELKEICPKRRLTASEQQCEDHFLNSYSRNEEGRYVVRLPFNSQKGLGDSRKMAIRRFTYMENRLQANASLAVQYRTFMNEYVELGHMTLVPKEEIPNRNTFYLPHHEVIKESSSTTKLRVVFDASAKSANGTSLNDLLMVGPKIQDDLVMLLLRFRLRAIAMTADIAKMYRQILVHNHDTRFQRIIWRDNPSEPLRDYQLNTVTYGTASAPFLATRILKQLASDVQNTYPMAAQVLNEDFYIDDLMTGADTTEDALQLQLELLKATDEGGFKLRKWTSNDPAVLHAIPAEMREIQGPLDFDNDESIKTLGLRWTPAADYFSLAVIIPKKMDFITKRSILSETAKVFDPLGLLSPVTIQAKLLLQDLWKLKIDWDDELPENLTHRWKNLQSDLPEIESLTIPRHISQQDAQDIGLHGFCDASEKAYAAAVYLKTKNRNGEIRTHLIAAKTKVAPLKQISLPKLELCGAVLLIRLVKLTQDSLKIKLPEIHCWTDSMTVLCWIASPPQRWKTFIANRVAEIQDTIPEIQWHQVKGEHNPADCSSRGISAKELQNHPLWWQGPYWLNQRLEILGTTIPPETEASLMEARMIPKISTHGRVDVTLLDAYSLLTTLLHVTAYMQRFARNARTIKTNRNFGPLSAMEIELALQHWIKAAQHLAFSEVMHSLATAKPPSSNSKLRSLNPFIDPVGILRVGGRIRNTNINTDQVHPMILPRKSKLTDLILVHEHLKHLHTGPQLLVTVIQRRYWIFGIRDAARFHIRR